MKHVPYLYKHVSNSEFCLLLPGLIFVSLLAGLFVVFNRILIKSQFNAWPAKFTARKSRPTQINSTLDCKDYARGNLMLLAVLCSFFFPFSLLVEQQTKRQISERSLSILWTRDNSLRELSYSQSSLLLSK